MKALQKEVHYTYSDYVKWDDEARYELIEGVPYMMASPSQIHQEISGEIFRQVANFLRGKSCKVFSAPFDVRLNADKEDDIVCQPDLLVVCDQSKLDGKSCKGAPDMVIEIISPSSVKYDRLLKFNMYLKAGVREYWIVDPESKTVNVFLLEDGKYVASVFGEADTASVSVLDGCMIELQEVFSY